MAQRPTFSPETRGAVRARTDGWCGICGCDLLEPDRFAVDHIRPRHGGGSDDLSNLQPAHERCNLMKSKRDLPGWDTSPMAASPGRPGRMVYDFAFPAPRYVEAMRRNGANPFVRVDEAPDSGSYIRKMNADQTKELLFHGACLTGRAGEVLMNGEGAHYFIWPHVASRGARYNGGVYSTICPAKADVARFTQDRAKGEEETLRRVAVAADLWLRGSSCSWPCTAARERLAEGAEYVTEEPV